MSDNLDLLAPKANVLEQIDTEPRAGGQWQLNLNIALDDGMLNGRAMADFILLGAQFSGTTLLHFESEDIKDAPGIGCDMDGEISPDNVFLTVILDDEELSRSPFECTGTALEPGKSYEGSVWAPCLDPIECGCDGAYGDFTLKRIESGPDAD
ncbi:MAG: hypothetical protein CMK09_05390 [Ponticaulis sp.]|nr:hypothetical protein [Ponticaulis sp.]|tara:strand:- start:647 stop:1105 length:459 start_codon:yes stop_codon:yes gene_type:complete